MQPFTIVAGPAAGLPGANIDTDVIMPKQFLKGIDRAGLGAAGRGRRSAGRGRWPRPDFVLNRPAWQGACILVVGPNFGCGSSREHAVWGLLQGGIRAVIGTSFAGIFADNAANNGLLLIELSPEPVADLAALAADPARNRMTIDLPAQTIATADGAVQRFDIPARRKDHLVRGLDAIGATLDHAEAIRAFQARHLAAQPWLV
jgi:3-isopropylmalate/(R)-2-methylmalate dehydratase small subunit